MLGGRIGTLIAVITWLFSAISLLAFQIHHRCHPHVGQELPNKSTWFPRHVASVRDAPPVTEDNSYDFSAICKWTEEAIEQRGTNEGLEALKNLGRKCAQRLPFDFENNTMSNIQPMRKLLPSEVTERVSDLVKDMEAEGQLSTNLDSVDGLPSFHLNLVSNGKSLFPKNKETNEFGKNIQKLLDLVEPYIYHDLLPKARELGQSDQIEVSDIFLRRYGQESEDARHGISAHYDVFSKVTAVIAMDDVAAEGTNGLYTTAAEKNGRTSNHASLRRYFPLHEGDGVIHSWDVLHGVDVELGKDRTSLICWFTEPSNNDISPWLIRDKNRLEKDDVTQFVLASVLESAHQMSGECNMEEENDSVVHSSDAAMSQSTYQMASSSAAKPNIRYNPHEWYLKSASRHNAFAFSRIGSICEAEEWANDESRQQALDVIDSLRPFASLPEPLKAVDLSECQRMAWRFWLEGALRGNPASQLSLADDLMVHATYNQEDIEWRLLATVLFGLAAQQGFGDALDRLAKVVELEVQQSNIHTQKQFQQNPVIQTAQAAVAATR